MSEIPPVDNPFWNQRFAGAVFKYGTAPNAFLAAQAHRLPAGAAVLVPGDGEGRNGVWLAQQGHRVLAIDSSTVGLAKARQLAGERGVPACALTDAATMGRAPQGAGQPSGRSGGQNARQVAHVADGPSDVSHQGGCYATALADLAHWQADPASADAVVLVYTHLPSALRRPMHRQLAAALKPGGLLLLEAFHPRQLGFSSGGPKDEDMLPTPEALHTDFADGPVGLEPLTAWSGAVRLDEGPGHQGDAWVTRWLGRRPEAPAS